MPSAAVPPHGVQEYELQLLRRKPSQKQASCFLGLLCLVLGLLLRGRLSHFSFRWLTGRLVQPRRAEGRLRDRVRPAYSRHSCRCHAVPSDPCIASALLPVSLLVPASLCVWSCVPLPSWLCTDCASEDRLHWPDVRHRVMHPSGALRLGNMCHLLCALPSSGSACRLVLGGLHPAVTTFHLRHCSMSSTTMLAPSCAC